MKVEQMKEAARRMAEKETVVFDPADFSRLELMGILQAIKTTGDFRQDKDRARRRVDLKHTLRRELDERYGMRWEKGGRS